MCWGCDLEHDIFDRTRTEQGKIAFDELTKSAFDVINSLNDKHKDLSIRQSYLIHLTVALMFYRLHISKVTQNTNLPPTIGQDIWEMISEIIANLIHIKHLSIAKEDEK